MYEFRLPQGVLTEQVYYLERGYLGPPMVKIPFANGPDKEEIRNVAEIVGNILHKKIKIPYAITEEKDYNFVEFYVVKPTGAIQPHAPDFKVMIPKKSLDFPTGSGLLIAFNDPQYIDCKHCLPNLEFLAKSLRGE